ncbi:MAG: HD-GYP domain-containing protein [Alphaproteobacteria bacterium]
MLGTCAMELNAFSRVHQTHAEILAGSILMLSRMFEIRDPHTHGHQVRVAQLAVAIGRELGLDNDSLTGLQYGAQVHDVGKIGVPVEMLTTSRRLSAFEMAIIRTHPVIGRDILNGMTFPWPIAEIVAQHHERMDGSGYPAGLKGDEITYEARIVAVADVAEAITHHRPYRVGLGLDAALSEISQNSGVLYDSQAVDACIRIFERANGQFWASEGASSR